MENLTAYSGKQIDMKDISRYLGKKVDVYCGEKIFYGYIFEYFSAENSDIGKDCIDVSLIDEEFIVEIALEDIEKIVIDDRYITFPVDYV